MTIIWCMVPEIWNVTDMIFVILDHFLPFYTHPSTHPPPPHQQPQKSKFNTRIHWLDWQIVRKQLDINFPINNFFFKNPAVTFLPLWSPNFMQKIRKILRAISKKTALPTNQLTKYQSVWFWANLEKFSWISPNEEFF